MLLTVDLRRLLTLTSFQIRIVTSSRQNADAKKKKHRGYAFIVFENERDMVCKYLEPLIEISIRG
jgi:hypothetical protein